MTSPFAQVARQLRQNGYSVVPILPHSKRPAVEKWTDYGIKPADDETFNRWMNWKDLNIGVTLGVASNLVAIDLDNDVDGLHAKIESLLPPTPVAKVGAKGKTLFYQYNGQKSQGYSKDGQRVLDILSQGRQTVLPPSIHPDGFPYRWLDNNATMITVPAHELPHISLQAVYEIGKIFVPVPHHVAQPRQIMVYDDSTLEELSAALDYIDFDDYETWYRIGMSLKDKLGERAFSLWDGWSAQSSKYKSTEMRSKWDSFKGSGLTIASLFYLAMDNGYSNMPTDYMLEPVTENFELDGKMVGSTVANSLSTVNSQLITVTSSLPKPEMVAAKATAEASPERKTDSIVFPSELLEAPGVPGKIMTFINKTSLIPQPVLALASAIAAAGTLMGRKVRGDTNLRTNTYIIGLAPSGSGKDHARTIIKRLFHDSGLGNLELGVPASSAGLITGLRSNGEGRGLILWDEFGRVLKQISNWKSGSHEKDIVTALIELFSSSQSTYTGKQYANHDGKNPMKPVDQPCLSIYGTSVPSHFYDAISGSEAVDGFLSRWLLFESKDYSMEEEDRDEVFSEVPQDLIDLCKEWKEQPFNSDPGAGNLADATRIIPRRIECSEEAAALLKDFATETRKIARACELSGENTASIWSRAGEHARRLALIGHEGERIEADVARWGIKVARYCCNYMSSAIADYVSSTELESNTKRLLRLVKDKTRITDTWVTRADITRAFQGVQARTRMEILGSLVERGEIIEDKQASPQGRPRLRYRAVFFN